MCFLVKPSLVLYLNFVTPKERETERETEKEREKKDRLWYGLKV